MAAGAWHGPSAQTQGTLISETAAADMAEYSASAAVQIIPARCGAAVAAPGAIAPPTVAKPATAVHAATTTANAAPAPAPSRQPEPVHNGCP